MKGNLTIYTVQSITCIRQQDCLSGVISINTDRIACLAALQPASWPAHNGRGPAASSTHIFIVAKTALPTTLLKILPTHIGLTAAH